MVTVLGNAVELLQNFGFFQVILPMLLIFGIFYAVLAKTKILGEMKDDAPHVKAVITLVSLAASFLIVTQTKVVEILNSLIPQASLLLVITMLILMLFAFLGFKTETFFGDAETGGKRWRYVIIIILLVIFAGIIDSSGQIYIPGIHELVLIFSGGAFEFPPLTDEAIQIGIALLLFLILPLLVIWFIIKKPKGGGAAAGG